MSYRIKNVFVYNLLLALSIFYFKIEFYNTWLSVLLLYIKLIFLIFATYLSYTILNTKLFIK